MTEFSLDPVAAAEMRRLVAEVLAEVLPGRSPSHPAPVAGPAGRQPGRAPAPVLAAGGVPSGVPAGQPATGRPTADGTAPGPPTPGPAEDSWLVRIGTDAELRDFALRVLRLADNPKLRRDLIAGRIRFRLAEPPAAAVSQAVYRVDKGAVTERAVAAAAKAGARLVLGPRAVLTPLARDKARALGVPTEKER
jgi:hypothetical protein